MSPPLISRNADLRRLLEDGYEVRVRGSHLVITHVPYVNARREVAYGSLVSTLHLSGDITQKPDTHVAHFIGEHPCREDGSEIATIKHSSQRQRLDEGLEIEHSFSSRPTHGNGYADYHEKMTTYIAIISGPAEALIPEATARTWKVTATEDPDSVFEYLDTASSRAGISAIARKLELASVAIVGLGGTGSYVLDLVAKTGVRAVHLFDGDQFLQHNAFRSPGAATLDELRAVPSKVEYLKARYAAMHRGLHAHAYDISAANVEELRGMGFVFLCLDKGRAKRVIIEKLHQWGVPFVDVGMGIQESDGQLGGILRVTVSTAERKDHVYTRISFGDGDRNDDYARNIQIADLNALNAALAVMKWKKLFGFYRDLEREHSSFFTTDGNHLTNEDHTHAGAGEASAS